MAKKIIVLIAALLICATICYAAAVTSSPYTGAGWNTGAPNDEALIGNSYQELQDLRKGVELRINREHVTLASSSAGGWHLNGSAVCYEGTTEEPNLPDDSAALSNIARDRGRLWLDDNFDPPVLKRWDGSAFEVIGTIASGSAPKAYLISDANEDTDGGRESKIIFKGEKDDDTSHELVMIQGSHDGTGDDYKADIIIFLNDGDDADGSLTEVLRIDSAKLVTLPGALTVTGVLTPSDALTMASGKTATVEIIQAVDSTGILFNSDAGTTVLTIEDSNTATLADSSQLATSAAPTTDADLANKKYVDDQDTADHPTYTGGESHTDGSGLITKMGNEAYTSTGTKTITFGTAFPNAIVTVVANLTHAAGHTHSNIGDMVINSESTTQFQYTVTDQPSDLNWIAIGY